MKKGEQEPMKDEYWSAHHYLFTAQFPTYYTKPQKVWGRFHTSEEQYRASLDREKGQTNVCDDATLCP